MSIGNKTFLFLLLILISSSSYSDTNSDDKERERLEQQEIVKRSQNYVGKEFWFVITGENCNQFNGLKPQRIQDYQDRLEGEPIKGKVDSIFKDDSYNPNQLKETEYTFVKIIVSDNKTVYMNLKQFMFEIDLLEKNRDPNVKPLMCIFSENPNINSKIVKKKSEKQKIKKPGVILGMTPKQVIEDTSWGKPESINRTTNQYGVHEQWVYGGRNYLYFDDGKLTSIQN